MLSPTTHPKMSARGVPKWPRSASHRPLLPIVVLGNQVASTLVWLWWIIDLHRFEFESGRFRWFYSICSCVENRICLSHGVQVTCATWWAVTRIVVGVGDLVQRTRDGQAQVGYSVAGRSRGQVTLCAVYTVHKETRKADFLVWPQNQGWWFVSGLASKPLGRVSWFVPQNRQLRFGAFGLKITATISWFGPQNQAGYGMSVVPQNRWED
jgi:hypothetical protein